MPLVGTTVTQLILTFKITYSKGERFIKNHLNQLIPHLKNQAMALVQNATHLVLGIYDFAIRKEHTYNTGFYDLRAGSLLSLVMGRTHQTLKEKAVLENLVGNESFDINGY